MVHGKGSTENLWEGLQVQVKVRMKEVSEVQDYSDVDLAGGKHKRADINRLIRDDEVEDLDNEDTVN